jgi:putative membrane protein
MLNIKRFHLALLFWLLIIWIVTAISPFNRKDWMMENILVITFFIVIIATYKKFPFSNFSYLLIALFLTLHLIGAHYTYSKVPLGFYIAEIFDLKRNHFDRIVHFSFGLLLLYPTREFLIRLIKIKDFFSFFLPFTVIFSCSATYELIEWGFVTLVTPELGEAYLGTQGDSWDSQQDMLMAVLGALVTTITILTKEKIYNIKTHH